MSLFKDPLPRPLEACPEELTAIAKRYEAFETSPALTRALLSAELLTPWIWDPCCGRGAMAQVMAEAGYRVIATDLLDWGYGEPGHDFLEARELRAPSVVMNPPFSQAEAFVMHALQLGARKVALIQRRAFWEGRDRTRRFWQTTPPNRIYTPVPRPAFWRFDIAEEDRGSGGEACHDVFVWEVKQPIGTLSGHLDLQQTPAFKSDCDADARQIGGHVLVSAERYAELTALYGGDHGRR